MAARLPPHLLTAILPLAGLGAGERPELSWTRQPPAAPRPGELRLVFAALERPAVQLPRLRALLSAEERARAETHLVRPQGVRFTVARARLRQLLAACLGCAPQEVRIAPDGRGKPELAAPPAPLAFNLSHAGSLALIALSPGPDIGVDVETPGPSRRAWRRIAERYFAPEEWAELGKADGEAAGFRRFLDHWVAKEAVLKAAGVGLTAPLSSVRTAAAVRDGGGVVRFGDLWWHCRLFDAPAGGRGAVAVAAGTAAVPAAPLRRSVA